MTSWEERMSAKAKARQAVEDACQRAEWAREEAARDRVELQKARALYEAGPPCSGCYVWTRDWYTWRFHWVHALDDCWHECHGRPSARALHTAVATLTGMVIHREFQRHLETCGCGTPRQPINQCSEALQLWRMQPDSYKIALA